MKRGNHSKSRASKGLVLILAMVLLVGAAIGGTVAWLTAQTPAVQNTFAPSDITITLTETGAVAAEGATQLDKSYKMVPGLELSKNPTVTVNAGSEPCWVFVKMEKGNNPDKYLTYSVNGDNWTQLPGHSDVWYKAVGTVATGALTENVVLPVLTGNKVTVRDTITKADMAALDSTDKYPNLTFTAYAIQQSSFTDVDDAWHEVSGEPADPATP